MIFILINNEICKEQLYSDDIYSEFRKRVERSERSAFFVSWPFCFTLTELNPFIYPRGGLCREGNMVKIFNRPIDRPFAG